ncbi:MAG: hypothetical protein CM1200mP30_31230 [Pseudomonadota bacterium]|nr:MAG: hypothetical protein CM1200mP30_31230 [Pseudomonadota bacterium]
MNQLPLTYLISPESAILWSISPFFQRSIVCRDLEGHKRNGFQHLLCLNCRYKKHVGTSFSFAENVKEALQMVHFMRGNEDAWRKRPFVSMSCCHVVPPLKNFLKKPAPVWKQELMGGKAGFFCSPQDRPEQPRPRHLGPLVVQAVAEVLAGLVYVLKLSRKEPRECSAPGLLSLICVQEPLSGGSGGARVF